MESRWLRLLRDIAANRRQLATAKQKGGKAEETEEKRGFFGRILEMVSVDRGVGLGELERTVKGLQLMQDETYMSIIRF